MKGSALVAVLVLAACGPAPSPAAPWDASSTEAPYPAWSLVVLPDTQQYAYSYPQIFAKQTEWIAENAVPLNIQYVLHVGDVTEWNGTGEWEASREAMRSLAGQVPVAIVPGNHDYVPTEERASRLTEFFPVADAVAMGGLEKTFEPDRIENTAHRFEVNGERWLILALEWGPRDAALAWANDMIDTFADHRVIILTHAYLFLDGTRYDWARKGAAQPWNPHSYQRERWPEVNDGEEIWQTVIRKRDNVHLVICGHAAEVGVSRAESFTDEGGQVHELLANYQAYPEGGGGYLRVLTFRRKEIEVTTYSPWMDASYSDPTNEFTLDRSGW